MCTDGSGALAFATAASSGADPTSTNTWTADQTFNDSVKITLGTGGDADLYYDGTNVILLPAVVGSGKVGIGTTSPATLLDVNIGASNDDNLTLSSENSYNPKLVFIDNNNSVSAGIEFDSGACAMRFFNNSMTTERMRIDSAGYVGIANADPNGYISEARGLVIGDTGDASSAIKLATSSTGIGSVDFTDQSNGSIQGIFSYEHANDAFVWNSSGSERMRIDSAGHVTMPLQPAVLAENTVARSNVTGDATDYTMIWNSEIFDQNGDFDGVSTFTAPVTGKYQIQSTILTTGVADNATYNINRIVASNRSLNMQSDGPPNSTVQHASLIDMDAGDTVYIQLTAGGGSKTVSVYAGTYTHVSWFLVA